MDRERIEKFVGLLVRVDLDGGQNLAGELKVRAFSPGQFEVVADGKHELFSADQVADIIRLHPAEVAEMKRDCICTEADLMSWTTCPLHRFDGQ